MSSPDDKDEDTEKDKNTNLQSSFLVSTSLNLEKSLLDSSDEDNYCDGNYDYDGGKLPLAMIITTVMIFTKSVCL